ncbi:MAG: hypothetical protein HKP30_11190 [Myxococcales bacterium]|nr:hypothetical protein [Myxococcales bacterium]
MLRIAAPRLPLAALALALLAGCAGSGPAPLQPLDRRIDLERFMGDWYVIGFIPIELPFFSEAGAHNAVESYRLGEEGRIETTYTFRDGGFDGPEKRFTPVGWVHDETTRTEWRMQFVWPFRSAYLIAWVDPDYQRTLIGVPDRGNVWIMSRTPDVDDAEYQALLDRAAALGYDLAKIQRVPHRWPEGG